MNKNYYINRKMIIKNEFNNNKIEVITMSIKMGGYRIGSPKNPHVI
jgi:hypothetical protein